MTASRAALCLLAGAALLGGCSRPSANQAAASSGPDVVISEADLPHLKAGQWETTITTDSGQPETSRHCETGESIKPKDLSKTCSQFVFKRTVLGGVVIDAVCGAGGVSSTMHMSIHGDFGGGYAGDSRVTLSVPGRPTQIFTTHSESHYIGPCP